jgi:hypothetical protein
MFEQHTSAELDVERRWNAVSSEHEAQQLDASLNGEPRGERERFAPVPYKSAQLPFRRATRDVELVKISLDCVADVVWENATD